LARVEPLLDKREAAWTIANHYGGGFGSGSLAVAGGMATLESAGF
jgi:hypothetical protein